MVGCDAREERGVRVKSEERGYHEGVFLMICLTVTNIIGILRMMRAVKIAIAIVMEIVRLLLFMGLLDAIIVLCR